MAAPRTVEQTRAAPLAPTSLIRTVQGREVHTAVPDRLHAQPSCGRGHDLPWDVGARIGAQQPLEVLRLEGRRRDAEAHGRFGAGRSLWLGLCTPRQPHGIASRCCVCEEHLRPAAQRSPRVHGAAPPTARRRPRLSSSLPLLRGAPRRRDTHACGYARRGQSGCFVVEPGECACSYPRPDGQGRRRPPTGTRAARYKKARRVRAP